MADETMLQLPVASSVDGSEYVWILQGGTDKRTTLAEIAATATGFVPTSRSINTASNSGLTGGGALSGDLSLSFLPSNLPAKAAMVVGDSFAINDSAAADTGAKTTFPNAMKALTGLSALGAPSLTDDYLIINRASDGLTYKINPSSLSLAAGNVPAGGLTNQFLAKASNADYDTEWTDPAVLLDALSLAGNPTGSAALNTSVTLGATLAFSGSALQTGAGTGDVSWSANSFSTTIGANVVTNAMLRTSSGLSVIGRSASTTGNVADIIGTADQILRVAAAGASVGFGSINIGSSAAVGASLLALANGGLNAALVAANGGIFYSTATAGALLGGTATAGQALLSGSNAAPSWSTNTFPTTAAAGTVLAAATANTISATATPTLGIVGSVLGSVTLAGNTSGSVLITPQAAAGSPTLTLPNTSGTFAASAIAPITLDATTGAIGITAAALTRVDDTNVTLTLGGTPASALLAATSLTLGWSGQLAVARGGTGLASGTSGGILGYTAAGTLASSAALTANGVVLGGGAGATPTSTSAGTNGQALLGNTSSAPTFQTPTVFVPFIIDGGGSAITTGIKGDIGPFSFPCTITGVTMLADQSGSIVVDLWVDSYANFPPTDADSITASAPPTISAATKSQDTTLTGWTVALAAGAIIRYNVDSAATVTRVTLTLQLNKTGA